VNSLGAGAPGIQGPLTCCSGPNGPSVAGLRRGASEEAKPGLVITMTFQLKAE
jgi:hypothetical protein